MNDLAEFLTGLIRESGVPQVELARRTGFSQKHVSGMLCHGEGLLTSWDRLLRAAEVTVEATS